MLFEHMTYTVLQDPTLLSSLMLCCGSLELFTFLEQGAPRCYFVLGPARCESVTPARGYTPQGQHCSHCRKCLDVCARAHVWLGQGEILLNFKWLHAKRCLY